MKKLIKKLQLFFERVRADLLVIFLLLIAGALVFSPPVVPDQPFIALLVNLWAFLAIREKRVQAGHMKDIRETDFYKEIKK